jgi:membrane-associated phospholipid phosphatase
MNVRAGPPDEHANSAASQIEPNAGSWRTWAISSGPDYRVPPPPGAKQTRDELKALSDLMDQNTPEIQKKIEFWDAGAPAYRWIDLLNNRSLAGAPMTLYSHRIYAYVAMAMYDATVAAWDSKYFYDRERPSEMDHKLTPAVGVPKSPSYPSEHSAAAQAAATVLAYLLPAEAQSFQDMADQAGWSRVQAGVQFPSDHYAGMALGKKVAEKVIELAKADGSDAVWTGTTPLGPCKWIQSGPPPGNVTAVNWKTLLLSSPSEFRPSPPPDCDSPELLAQAAAVRNFPRTFVSNYKAFYWQSPDGLSVWPYRWADKWMFEDKLQGNAPRVARSYALIASVLFDAFIASQDGKFTYWLIRPHQYDSGIVPLFPVPNFPSYPSNHSTFSAARSEILAYLFPTRADTARALGKEAGDSRIWAGIHFPIDNEAGVKLGKSVANVFIDWAQNDGSQ